MSGRLFRLGGPLVGHVEHILFYHSRLKPLAEHFLVDYDIVKQPFVADMVEASLDVAPTAHTGWSGDLHPAFMTL